jgi:DNA-binding LytR/AlgR family response regulator
VQGHDAELLRIIAQLKAQEALVAISGQRNPPTEALAVYYIESVDNKTFLYLKDKVYESKQKLYELEEILAAGDFLRCRSPPSQTSPKSNRSARH